MIIDTHSHLNFNAYKDDLEQVIGRCRNSGVSVINIGSKYETSKRAIEIAEKYGDGFFASIGLHPIHAVPGLIKIKTDPEEGSFTTTGEDLDIEKYRKLAESKKVVAIGEIGLDYYYKPKSKQKLALFKERQKEIFIKQLDLAQELNLPVIFHCRMAHQDLCEILDLKLKTESYNLKGVVHCFTGNWEEAKRYLDMGFCLGFNGIIFKLDLEEVIKKTPLDKILVETDCPYLTPPEAGTERNEPVFVKYVIKKVAEVKGVEYEKLAEITVQNAKNLFGI